MKDELIHNATGYVLLFLGVGVIFAGAHTKLDKLTETGAGLISAALLAFQRTTSPKV